MSKRVEFDRQKAVELYKSGITPTEIGRLFNVNYGTIIAHLKKEGVYKPTRTRKRTRGSKPVASGLNVLSLGSYISNKVNESGNPKKTKPENKEQLREKRTKKSSKPKKKLDFRVEDLDSFDFKVNEVTLEEKIAYCDAKYGKDNWYFMTKQEVLDALFFDNII